MNCNCGRRLSDNEKGLVYTRFSAHMSGKSPAELGVFDILPLLIIIFGRGGRNRGGVVEEGYQNLRAAR